MRSDILSVLSEEKAQLTKTVQECNAAILGLLGEQIRTTADGVFIPMRDGI